MSQVLRLLAAQSPLLGTAMLGLPGLSVPTGMAGGMPAGVQIVAGRFREDRCLAVGERVEAAAHFSALDVLAPRGAGKGRLSKNVSVIDVSPSNDWTQVRVWYPPVKDYGSPYLTFGFVLPDVQQAAYKEPGPQS